VGFFLAAGRPACRLFLGSRAADLQAQAGRPACRLFLGGRAASDPGRAGPPLAQAVKMEAGPLRNTVHNWIIDVYAIQKDVVVPQLHAASGLVHVTLDGWTSCNNWAMLGVISHSLRDSGIAGHIVLGLREIEGTHDGENLCSILIQILSEYNIGKSANRL